MLKNDDQRQSSHPESSSKGQDRSIYSRSGLGNITTVKHILADVIIIFSLDKTKHSYYFTDTIVRETRRMHYDETEGFEFADN